MIGEYISRLFRRFNSRLIYTDNVVVEKCLKVVLFVSSMVYRRQLKSKRKSTVLMIENFDSTIRMEVDISRSMGCAIYWTGFHEFREFIFLHRFLKPHMVFVDV